MPLFVNGQEKKCFVNGQQMNGYVNGVKVFGQRYTWDPLWARIAHERGYTEFQYVDTAGVPVNANEVVGVGDRLTGMVYYATMSSDHKIKYRQHIASGVVEAINGPYSWGGHGYDDELKRDILSRNSDGAMINYDLADDTKYNYLKYMAKVKTIQSFWINGHTLTNNYELLNKDGQLRCIVPLPDYGLKAVYAILYGDKENGYFIIQNTDLDTDHRILWSYDWENNTVEKIFELGSNTIGTYPPDARRRIYPDGNNRSVLVQTAIGQSIYRTSDGINSELAAYVNPVVTNGYIPKRYQHLGLMFTPQFAHNWVTDEIFSLIGNDRIFPGWLSQNTNTNIFANTKMFIVGNRIFDIVPITE